MNARDPIFEFSEHAEAEIEQILDGRRSVKGSRLLFAGPAVIASIAYMDPGNFATNLQAGARYGYALLWVVLLANVIAMLFQALSAKLGIATGRNLAELCAIHLPRAVSNSMWGVSEVAAMATDLAEFVGGAIGLSLLFHIPLLLGMVITGVVTYVILLVDRWGFRPIELVIGALVLLITFCYGAELFIVHTSWIAVAKGTLIPSLPDHDALIISVGILGATVMPHALFLHSSLIQSRGQANTEGRRRKMLRFSNAEVVIALTVAGLVNMAMVMMASSAFHAGHPEVAEIETAYHSLTPLLGHAAAQIFLLSLIASGISSSVVGTMAGQTIMQGFMNFKVPIWFRRVITMIPAFIVIGSGVDPTRALIYSQVVLSIALPVPMIALLIFTARPDIMGPFRNRPSLTIAAVIGTAITLGLNGVLIVQTISGS